MSWSGSTDHDGDIAKNKRCRNSEHIDYPGKKRRRKARTNLDDDYPSSSCPLHAASISDPHRDVGATRSSKLLPGLLRQWCLRRGSVLNSINHFNAIVNNKAGVETSSLAVAEANARGHPHWSSNFLLDSGLFESTSHARHSISDLMGLRLCESHTCLAARQELPDFSRLHQQSGLMAVRSDYFTGMPLIGGHSLFGPMGPGQYPMGSAFHSTQSSSLARNVGTAVRTHQMPYLPFNHLHWLERSRQVVALFSGNNRAQSARLMEAASEVGATKHPGVGRSESLASLLSLPSAHFTLEQQIPGTANVLPIQSNEAEVNRGILVLAVPQDHGRLNEQQIFLRHQIEVFRASADDIMSHTRGRNRAVTLLQVGLRCRHCGHLPVGARRKGSTYFPSALISIYQAAQNLNLEHFQSGLCQEMSDEFKLLFRSFSEKRAAASFAGKPYWADAARQLGLIDTEEGIRFAVDIAAIRHPYPGFAVGNR